MSTRQETIINYLKVKPTTKGQIEVDTLKPNSVSKAKTYLAKKFLSKQGVNFQPLIIREVDYFEYSVLYGSHWVYAAVELGIDRLYAWEITEDRDEHIQEMIEMIQMLS